MQKIILLLSMLLMTSVAQATKIQIDPWTQSGKKVCDQVTQAYQYYKNGDLKKAHVTAIMSYFKLYDAEIEPAVRITLGGPHVFEIEGKFQQYAKAMTPNPNKQQLQAVSALAKDLCEAVYSDTKALNDANVPQQVFAEK